MQGDPLAFPNFSKGKDIFIGFPSIEKDYSIEFSN